MFRSRTINQHKSVPAPPHPMMPRWHHLHPHGIGIHFPSVRIQDRNQRHHNTLGQGRGVLSIAHKNGSLKPGYACSSGWYASKAVDANLNIAPKNEDWITWNANSIARLSIQDQPSAGRTCASKNMMMSLGKSNSKLTIAIDKKKHSDEKLNSFKIIQRRKMDNKKVFPTWCIQKRTDQKRKKQLTIPSTKHPL